MQKAVEMMGTCGMNEASEEWVENVQLCAKCSVSGCMLIVVPGVFGLSIYSPKLDEENGKVSVRGYQFCQQLVQRFPALKAFHY